MIIPQIAENLTCSGELELPQICPACHGKTEIRQDNDVETLVCPNPECPAKKLKSFALFAGRDAMNIDGMSEMTLEKFIGRGFISEPADIFRLSVHRDEICKMDGFGEKSYNNLLESIERARHAEPARLLYSLGILNVGLSNARLICKHFDNDLEKVRRAGYEELTAIDGVGGVIAGSVCEYFSSDENNRIFDDLLKEVVIEKPEAAEARDGIAGKSFVITGSLHNFENRDALKTAIENAGGKVTGSVSSNTDYLINNDINSTSSKNKKAKELSVPIITEDEVMDLLGLKE